jgi:hypothetical protein
MKSSPPSSEKYWLGHPEKAFSAAKIAECRLLPINVNVVAGREEAQSWLRSAELA